MDMGEIEDVAKRDWKWLVAGAGGLLLLWLFLRSRSSGSTAAVPIATTTTGTGSSTPGTGSSTSGNSNSSIDLSPITSAIAKLQAADNQAIAGIQKQNSSLLAAIAALNASPNGGTGGGRNGNGNGGSSSKGGSPISITPTNLVTAINSYQKNQPAAIVNTNPSTGVATVTAAGRQTVLGGAALAGLNIIPNYQAALADIKSGAQVDYVNAQGKLVPYVRGKSGLPQGAPLVKIS